MGKLFLKKGKEKILYSRNSWLYTGAVEKREDVNIGEIVEVYTAENKLAGYGFYYGGKNIEAYLFDFSAQKQNINKEYWKKRFENAFQLRKNFVLNKTSAYRLIHSEGDGIPGLTVDVYNDIAVIDFKISGTENLYKTFAGIIKEMGFTALYVSDDVSGNLKGQTLFGEVPEQITIEEYDLKFLVDIVNGQKTGFFIDQRENRKLLEDFAQGRNVLNLFSYTGGFSVYALHGGARQVWSVDVSLDAIKTAEKNVEINGLDTSKHIVMKENAFDVLNNLPSNVYDLIVLDPPAFAKKEKDIPNAIRAYREINTKAIEKIAQGGIIFTFSCSQKIDKETFNKIVFTSAARTGRKVRILHRLTQPPDHPIDIYQPKSEYLKGLVLEVN
jgi:23S rRNA (cytosine1962-C5)-methyltransferase